MADTNNLFMAYVWKSKAIFSKKTIIREKFSFAFVDLIYRKSLLFLLEYDLC